MKKVISGVIIVLMALFLGACDEFINLTELNQPNEPNPALEATTFSVSYRHFTFEEAVTELTTDVVVAQFVRQRQFGENLIEFEFAVTERILGTAADRIFVYEESNLIATVIGGEREIVFRPGDMTFNLETEYLLPLIKHSTIYSKTHEDGYLFVSNIAIDLNAPFNSVMYNEPLSQHTNQIDFNNDVSRDRIISYIDELTKNNTPSKNEFIRSDVMNDIISESPYVWVIEINEPFRLSSEQSTTDWMDTDIYYGTVLQVLKGDTSIGYEFTMIFFADTVKPGEHHIVAIESPREGSTNYRFTSRNSLFNIEKLEEIKLLLEGSR